MNDLRELEAKLNEFGASRWLEGASWHGGDIYSEDVHKQRSEIARVALVNYVRSLLEKPKPKPQKGEKEMRVTVSKLKALIKQLEETNQSKGYWANETEFKTIRKIMVANREKTLTELHEQLKELLAELETRPLPKPQMKDTRRFIITEREHGPYIPRSYRLDCSDADKKVAEEFGTVQGVYKPYFFQVSERYDEQEVIEYLQSL